MRRSIRSLVVLLLAPTLGVACGDPSLSTGIHQQNPTGTVSEQVEVPFPPVPRISIVEHSMRCATLEVGGVVTYDTCLHSDSFPAFAYANIAQRLMLFNVDSGETIAFVDGGYARLLTSTDHWVVAQLSSRRLSAEVWFTLTSDAGARACVLTTQLFMRCTS